MAQRACGPTTCTVNKESELWSRQRDRGNYVFVSLRKEPEVMACWVIFMRTEAISTFTYRYTRQQTAAKIEQNKL